MDEIVIERLNRRGEGVAGPLTLEDALPGERVVEGRALPTSPDRAQPFCPYYGECGGCAAQHMGERIYAGWKRDSVLAALARAGVHGEVGALVDAHGAGRRRATFHARFPAVGNPQVGFMRARAHEIVDIATCPLFCPELAEAASVARALASDLRNLGKPLDIQVTATLAGLDVDIRGSGPLPAVETQKLIRSAERQDLARVSNHGAALIERRPPEVAFGKARVALPAGGFLQATQEGEEILARLALEAVSGAKRVADLFCGAGAFALRLAQSHEVFAADSDAAAIAALKRAAGATAAIRPVEAIARDLFQRPLRSAELERFDAVLFDPPRAGALAQAKEIAGSAVPAVVAISCNAETFARDARLLIDGGYRMGTVTPVDQFRYSPHVEIVADFRKPRVRKRRSGVLG